MKTATSPKIIVLILGMHRSGTSMLAKSLAEAGLPLGSRLMTEARSDSPEGYWEDEDVVAVQEALLIRRFGEAADVWGVDGLEDVAPYLQSDDAWRQAVDRLSKIVSLRFSQFGVFAVKDPRSARMIALWREIAERTGARIIAIHALRHPSAVAASLASRNAIDPTLGELMWLRTIRDILAAPDLAVDIVSCVDYDKWSTEAESNRAAVEALFVASNLRPPDHWRSTFKAEHRHERASPARLRIAEDVYKTLATTTPGVPDEATRRRLLQRIDDLTNGFLGWRSLAGAALDAGSGPRHLPLPPRDGASSPAFALGACRLKHANKWCGRLSAGYSLHANPAGEPSAALEWEGLWSKAPATIEGELRRWALQGRDMLATIELGRMGGPIEETRRRAMTSGDVWRFSITLEPVIWYWLRITVEVKPDALDARAARVQIASMKMLTPRDDRAAGEQG